MPSMVQCQACCFAFNTGVNVDDFLHVYCVCYSCGATHRPSFQIVDGKFSLLDCLVDKEGPRRIPVRRASHNVGFDLTLSAPVAEDESFLPYFQAPIPVSKDLKSIIERVNCGRCHAANMRASVESNRCPLCDLDSLQVVGGWM